MDAKLDHVNYIIWAGKEIVLESTWSQLSKPRNFIQLEVSIPPKNVGFAGWCAYMVLKLAGILRDCYIMCILMCAAWAHLLVLEPIIWVLGFRTSWHMGAQVRTIVEVYPAECHIFLLWQYVWAAGSPCAGYTTEAKTPFIVHLWRRHEALAGYKSWDSKDSNDSVFPDGWTQYVRKFGGCSKAADKHAVCRWPLESPWGWSCIEVSAQRASPSFKGVCQARVHQPSVIHCFHSGG